MDKYNGNLNQALKWMENAAPNIQALIADYQSWRTENVDQFWDNWYSSVFNIDTANAFGLLVWCTILGVPSDLIGLGSNNYAWAFGEERKNFVYEDILYNSLLDSDFESGGYGWDITSGSPFVPSLVSFANDESVGPVAILASGNGSQIASISQTIAVNPGTTRTFAISFKFSDDYVANSTFDNTKIRINDQDGNVLLDAQLNGAKVVTGQWLTQTVSVTFKSTSTSATFGLRNMGTAGNIEFKYARLYRPENAAPTYPEKVGGNFFGVPGALTGMEEVRFLLKLRYASLVSNGTFLFINRMLNFIINKGEKLQSPDDNIIVVDNTALSVSNPVSADYTWEYRIGKNVKLSGSALSDKLISILNDRSTGIIPSIAGVSYTVIQES